MLQSLERNKNVDDFVVTGDCKCGIQHKKNFGEAEQNLHWNTRFDKINEKQPELNKPTAVATKIRPSIYKWRLHSFFVATYEIIFCSLLVSNNLEISFLITLICPF